MEISAETRDALALHLVPGLGPRLTAALLQRFGSAAAARRASVAQLQSVPHIGPKLSRELSEALSKVDVDAELALLAKHEVGVLAPGTAEYPACLVEIPDPPPLLYVRGALQAADSKAV